MEILEKINENPKLEILHQNPIIEETNELKKVYERFSREVQNLEISEVERERVLDELREILYNPFSIDLTEEIKSQSIENTIEFCRCLDNNNRTFSARCMPSRSQIREDIRMSEYHKRMVSERSKFIAKYPILNPSYFKK